MKGGQRGGFIGVMAEDFARHAFIACEPCEQWLILGATVSVTGTAFLVP